MSAADTVLPAPALARLEARATTRAGYRADIDGLRGIAVLAVVLAHAGVRGFEGGFIGVDVFFVISGYLITRNLEHHPPSGWRGLRAFYGRRLRRTLPALYLVVAVTLLLGLLILLPGELDDLARSAVATLLFVPNILFLNQAGYFDHAAGTKPLLHSWSLGVEEQFYLFAPLLPWALHRLAPNWRKAALLGLFALSLAFCIGLRSVAAPAAFYLMPARLWEFLAGALVAERAFPAIGTRWLAEALGVAALAVLAASICLFSAATLHPGLMTLLPCAATAMLIQLGGQRLTLAGRLLGSRALSGVGLISYSVYLWHWPLLVLARTAGFTLDPARLLLAGAGLLGLSTLSWRFVERPFRAAGSPLRRHAAPILLTAATALGSTSLVMIAARGLPSRFSPEVAGVASYYDYADRRQFREGSCFITSKYGSARYFDWNECLRLAADKPNILLLGDSHAAHLWFGLKTVFKDANILQATASGCKPLLHPTGKRYCTDLMTQVFRGYLPRHPVDTIVLSAAWGVEDLPQLAPTLAYLRPYARKVVVIGLIPGHASPLPTLLARSLLRHDGEIVRDQEQGFVNEVDRLFRQAVPQGQYVSLVDALCPQGHCVLFAAPGIPLQFDTDHLTSEGSVLVARAIARTHALDLVGNATAAGRPPDGDKAGLP